MVPAVSFCHLQYSKKKTEMEQKIERAYKEELNNAKSKINSLRETVMVRKNLNSVLKGFRSGKTDEVLHFPARKVELGSV